MRRLVQSLLLAVALSCAALPGLASAAEVNQAGSYTFTMVRQRGERVATYSHQFDEAQYEQLKANAAKSAEIYARRTSSERFKRRCGLTSGVNTASIAQSGRANLASARQTGANNSAAIAQQGVFNAAYTVQAGSGYDAQTAQLGDYNIALVVQLCR
jgi:hypothetical protein